MEDERSSGAHIRLDGASNWNLWKFQTMILLRGQDLLDVVEGKGVKPEAAAEKATWEKKDAKAQTWLVTRMSENAMRHILTCTTSAAMWRKLTSIYEQKSETSIHVIQQRFFQYKYEEGTEMASFLSKIEELKGQLMQMGQEVPEKFVITKVLMSLPDSYKHFISAWESAPADKQTFDILVARLMTEEERIKEKGDVSLQSTSAFVAKKIDKKSVKCFKCNRLGHYRSECRSQNDNKQEVKKCFYCKKPGHLKNECWFKNQKEKDGNAFVVVNSSEHFEQSQWLVDTGASQHMCNNRDLFTTFSSITNKSVIVGNGSVISADGCGQVTLQVSNGREWVNSTIDNVLFVPDLKTNLFSVKCATDRGYVMTTDGKYCTFYNKNKVCAIANRHDDMYYMTVRYYKREQANVVREWHEKLAHQNIQYVKSILKRNDVPVKEDNFQCESCLKGKIHRLPFNNSSTKSSRTCEIIHADTCGPMEVPSVAGSRYFIVLKDDFSNFRSVYFVKRKDEVKKCIENFMNKAENITRNKVLYFRSDNGSEFVNKEVRELFEKRGIIHQTTVPYTPEQNGKAERENRTLVEAARTMLCAKSLSKKLWAEAINTAAYVLNRTGISNESGKTPYETWTNKHFDINELRIFGTPVYVHIPKEKRRKWDSKGQKGIMVGYSEITKGYRIFFPEKNDVEIRRDVVFLDSETDKVEKEKNLERNKQLVMIESDSEEQPRSENQPSESENLSREQGEGEKLSTKLVESETQNPETAEPFNISSGSDSLYTPCDSDDESCDEETDLPLRQHSTRVRKQTSFYKCQHVFTEENEPKTYREAMQRSDAGRWQEAIKKELETLKENNTWEVCSKEPVNVNIISSKWVFKIKNCNNKIQYKARLVARGFEQNDILNEYEIYAPVAKLSTFRLFVSIATKYNLPIYQMDVTGAFLYGNIEETVYLELPEGAYYDNKKIVKLNRSLYGLKKSPKYWNDKFNSVIIKEGFIRSLADSCFYIKCNGDSRTYVLLYVDDLLIFGNSETEICDLKSVLNSQFKMKDLGLVSTFLGINVKQDLINRTTELCQKEYLNNVLKKYNMENCKGVSTPMDYNFNTNMLEQSNDCVVDRDIENMCRKIIGCLSYAVLGTRPDICIVLSILSRFQSKANNALLVALKRVLRYIKHTLDYKLVYRCNGNLLEGYCDANWGGDLRDRKSTTGYCFMYANCLISWCSKKQVSVSLSSTESEYVAMSMAASEACWLVNLLRDFKESVCPVQLKCDNQSAIMSANTDCVKRLKHIDIRFHFVRDLIKKGTLVIKYVKTEEQVADMFTKALNKNLLLRFITDLGLGK